MASLLGHYRQHVRGDDAAPPAVGRGRSDSGVAVAELHPLFDEAAFVRAAPPAAQPFLAGLRAAQLFEVFINEHLEMSEGERDASPFERLLNSAEWEMEMQGWAGGAPAFGRATSLKEVWESRGELRDRTAAALVTARELSLIHISEPTRPY